MQTPKTMMTAATSSVEKDSRREACSTETGTAAEVGGETIDIRKIRLLQIRMLFENPGLAHSGARPAEHIPDGNTATTNARLSPFSGSTVILLIAAASISGKLPDRSMPPAPAG